MSSRATPAAASVTIAKMVAFEQGGAPVGYDGAETPAYSCEGEEDGERTFQGSAVPADSVTFKVLATVSLNVVRLRFVSSQPILHID
jgi:hypothetical protein